MGVIYQPIKIFRKNLLRSKVRTQCHRAQYIPLWTSQILLITTTIFGHKTKTETYFTMPNLSRILKKRRMLVKGSPQRSNSWKINVVIYQWWSQNNHCSILSCQIWQVFSMIKSVSMWWEASILKIVLFLNLILRHWCGKKSARWIAQDPNSDALSIIKANPYWCLEGKRGRKEYQAVKYIIKEIGWLALISGKKKVVLGPFLLMEMSMSLVETMVIQYSIRSKFWISILANGNTNNQCLNQEMN